MTAVLAWLFLPPVRSEAQARVHRALAWGRGATQRWAQAGARGARGSRTPLRGRAGAALAWLRASRRGLLLALAVLLLLPALALSLRAWWRLEGFDHTASRSVDEHVAALLQGEQLVPPPPLPPELFSTLEVEAARPLLRTASRQWELLDADFRRRLLLLFKLLKDQHGYDAVLLEGYRSPERQEALARLGPALTQAGAYESYHQFGLAADVAFLRDGRIVISERDAWALRGYELYGELAASLGLTWGGNWRGLADYGHVELRRPGVLQSRTGPAATAPAPAPAR
ncbi:M15 family metallopeptidase [Aquabacterium sp.]|uniref:M15 family metallopeptidase n=1 Tax=Aquabacterium sp. TaxID=1872578 RepID=UPI002C343517|nr:M15 family metallopeptidase [Aquabacterium sp.]HSW04156.1 M15 family metallopeptidase [Aquabacterium sp.]